MHCAACGALLPAGARNCGVCGHVVAAAEKHSARTPAGLPVGRYVPSSYGPPVRPDVLPQTSAMEAEAPARRAFGYRPVELPPPVKQRGGAGRRTLVRLCLLVLVLGLVVIGTANARGALPLRNPFGGAGGNGAAVTATRVNATATAAVRACPAVPVNATAAQALAHVQLTTGLRDAAAHDYRPVNSASAFSAGQTGYVVFQVVSGAAGTVGVVFCTPQERVVGSVGVPAGSSGRYGEFAARFASGDAGQGRVTLTWNGAVAAEAPFTVGR